jgi:dolichyl-phosphate-mannose-protein mannosyltransferase
MRSPIGCSRRRDRVVLGQLGQMTKRLLLILLLLSALLHGFRLSEPREIVFDEVHFGGFINDYIDGQLFFDIHPPHAKLLLTGFATLGGYRGEQRFQELGEPMSNVSPARLRYGPALAGTLIPLVLFGLLLQLGASPMAAFLGGLAALLDNALLVQTRLITLDGFLLIAIFGSVACFLAAQGSADRMRRTRLSLFAGLLAGLAPGIKFTGLAALGLIGVCILVHFLARPSWGRLRVGASQTVWVLAGACFIYSVGWALHFWLLDEPRPGYRWLYPTGDLLADTIEVHRTMLRANYGLRVPHPHSSPWWAWPLMARPVFYWSEGGAALHFVGNPVLWWGTALGLVVVAANGVLLKVTDLSLPEARKPWPRLLWIPAVGYLIAFLPLIPVGRPLFLYHYLSPLLFGLCVVVLWLDHVGWTRAGGFRSQRLSFHAAIAALVLGFVVMSPFTFSFIGTTGYRDMLVGLLPIWP